MGKLIQALTVLGVLILAAVALAYLTGETFSVRVGKPKSSKASRIMQHRMRGAGSQHWQPAGVVGPDCTLAQVSAPPLAPVNP